MTEFLTVKQAALKTAKSPSSIRRIIYPIIARDDHPDRLHIRPTVEEVKVLRVQGDNFAWKVSEEFLARVAPASEPGAGNSPKRQTTAAEPLTELEMVLTRELEIKNQQIAAQNEMMKSLSERLREGNILIGSLQQQYALSDGSRRKGQVVESKGTGAGESKPQKQPKAKKQSLFARWFSAK